MFFENLFFDLDATLYPESNGLWPAIRVRIDQYMRERMNFAESEIPKLRENFYRNYGTTLRGLQIHYGIEARDYLNYVHDLPLHQYLQPDPALRTLLLSLPQKRWIFTNSDQPHAERVMKALGIADCFDGLVDVYALEPHCKPQPEAYQLALEIAEVSDPQICALLDDSPHNLAPAQAMGFFTVLIGENGHHPSAQRSVSDIHDLAKAVPEFWENHKP